MKQVHLQILISLAAISLIVAHIISPSLAIDGVTLGLIVVAIIPWLAPLFKSLQLPGGVKIEYQDLEKTEKQIKDAGLLPKIASQKSFDFVPSPNDDPTIALAWLRIEIEKRLRDLVKKNKMSDEKKLIRNLIALYENGVFNEEEKTALLDLVQILSSAIHGVPVDQSAADWAIEVGPHLLKGLDNKLKKK